MTSNPGGRLHVLVIIDSLNAGGAEMLLSDFAVGAGEADMELSVAYLAELGGSPALPRLRDAGVEPFRIPYHGLLNPATIRAARRHIRAVSPDVVHTHLDYADAVGGVAARSLRMPSVSTVHVMEWRSDGARRRIRGGLFRAARRRTAARVIAVSEASRQAMIASHLDRPERIVTIRNGVDAPRRPGAGRTLRAELGIAEGELVVAQVAVLREGKGHDAAAAAVAALLERGLPVRLLLVGDGPDRKAVERAIAPLGRSAIALGHRDDVMTILDAADAVVAPSTVDAFPTALLEAMAAGVPVVATAVGGIPEIVVPGETGLLIPAPADAEELADALARVLADPSLRTELGDAARSRYESEFTASSWAGRTRGLYDEVLGAGRGR